MKVFKRIKWSYVVLSAMFLLLGIYLVVNPETSLVMICRILGAAMAVFGVMKIVLYFIREVEGVAIRFDFAVGLFCIILGALMLWRAPALTDILSVMIGLLVLVDSVFKLQVAVDSRRMGAHSWWVTLVCTVVCLVLGILLVFNPFDGKQVLTIMMGVSLIVDGVQNLCTVVYAAIFVKDVKAAVQRGLGVAVISALAVQEELAAGKLLSFDLDRSGVFRRIYLAWPAGCPLTAAERRFADYVLSHAEGE